MQMETIRKSIITYIRTTLHSPYSMYRFSKNPKQHNKNK
jgi:hypothetical protein